MSLQGGDPAIDWQAYLMDEDVSALAELADAILHLVANQAGNECNFSDSKIKKTRLPTVWAYRGPQR